jgi:hypothetical protein
LHWFLESKGDVEEAMNTADQLRGATGSIAGFALPIVSYPLFFFFVALAASIYIVYVVFVTKEKTKLSRAATRGAWAVAIVVVAVTLASVIFVKVATAVQNPYSAYQWTPLSERKVREFASRLAAMPKRKVVFMFRDSPDCNALEESLVKVMQGSWETLNPSGYPFNDFPIVGITLYVERMDASVCALRDAISKITNDPVDVVTTDTRAFGYDLLITIGKKNRPARAIKGVTFASVGKSRISIPLEGEAAPSGVVAWSNWYAPATEKHIDSENIVVEFSSPAPQGGRDHQRVFWMLSYSE